MKCNKHDRMVVMHAFSTGNCIKCDEEVTTPHIPCNKVCPECSETYGLCEICGDEMLKTKKKLKLEVLDPTGEVVKTHHFFYEAGEGNKLRLSITDNVYIMDKDGKLVILTQEDLYKEHLRNTSSVKIDNNLTKDLRVEPQYYNPKTKKTQKLFEKLVPVFTIGCSTQDIVSGDKGCAVYITVEAEDIEHAKDKAMLNEEFMSHIYDRKNFDRKYLQGHEPIGNYVIGKVLYYEGDPRL